MLLSFSFLLFLPLHRLQETNRLWWIVLTQQFNAGGKINDQIWMIYQNLSRQIRWKSNIDAYHFMTQCKRTDYGRYEHGKEDQYYYCAVVHSLIEWISVLLNCLTIHRFEWMGAFALALAFAFVSVVDRSLEAKTKATARTNQTNENL